MWGGAHTVDIQWHLPLCTIWSGAIEFYPSPCPPTAGLLLYSTSFFVDPLQAIPVSFMPLSHTCHMPDYHFFERWRIKILSSAEIHDVIGKSQCIPYIIQHHQFIFLSQDHCTNLLNRPLNLKWTYLVNRQQIWHLYSLQIAAWFRIQFQQL